MEALHLIRCFITTLAQLAQVDWASFWRYNSGMVTKKEQKMGFKILGRTEDIMQGYGPLPKLEGPFYFNGRILYYDPKEGKYWDPKTDFYVPHDEYFRMVGLM